FATLAAFASLLCAPVLLAGAAPAPAPSRTLADRAGPAHPINPVDAALKPLAMAPATPMTNAQRLKRGLAPNRPKFPRSSPRKLAPRASSTPQPGCTPRYGALNVVGAGVPPAAFVARVPNEFGEYGVTADFADALVVLYLACPGSAAALPVDLVTQNGLADYTYFGGITGFANTSPDLEPGSANYAYLGGILSSTGASAPPQDAPNSFTYATGDAEDVESTIWSVSPVDGAVSARWVNTDGAPAPATQAVYFPAQNFLLLTADPAAVEAEYGPSDVVALTFV
ncbi:hypothetical protein DAEQUDRAFT_636100, partial [Daedalea quercina L-15889]